MAKANPPAMLGRLLVMPVAGAALCCALAAAATVVILPSGWHLSPSWGPVAATGTMPQGLALSPNGKLLAVVESGTRPAALRLLQTPGLRVLKVVGLKGAFGKPVWRDGAHVLVAGAATDAVFDVDARTGATEQMPIGKGAWPAAVAARAVTANDGNGTVTVGAGSVAVGQHPADVALLKDGTLYVSVRQGSYVAVVRSGTVVKKIAAGLHPGALAVSNDGSKLYVAESDDDAVGVIDTRSNARMGDIRVGVNQPRANEYGASPNALAVNGSDLFVSLGAQNAVALIRNGHVVRRIPAGWYPTGVAVGADGTLYVSNGKGEGSPANPQFNPFLRASAGYVADITAGSVRAIPRSEYETAQSASAAAIAIPEWTPAPDRATVLKAHGPIRHVIYVIKENRSYDQILGDVAAGNGDPKLVQFGKDVTPNQHALAARFGLFDNAYADAQVSADGHNWTDAAFANDYVERYWPVTYGGRRDAYDFQNGTAPDVPHNGYIWDDAARARVTFRNYGEDVDFPGRGIALPVNTFPGLRDRFDPRYIGWDLSYSDLSRYAEWKREFDAYAAGGNLPQLEIVYLPNDHTAGTAAGKLTPQAYIATNDLAAGKLVDTVSHSRYWKSTAIFILEDDAQSGADHVSAQRSTFYVASPYAKGGVRHAHYSTVSVLHTIELLLGLRPLSIYDQTALPMYDAFSTRPVNAAPFTAVRPNVNLNEVNSKAAYGAAISARMDFSRADAANPAVLNDILAHAVRTR